MHNIPFSNLFRPEILQMKAYQVADSSNLIKLDAMENPYNWPENLQQQWLEALKNCPLNRYPDPQANKLSHLIKQQNQIGSDIEILLGNGSDEIIQLLLMALNDNASILAPHPGFVMYHQIALSLGLRYINQPLLTENFDLDLTGMLESIEKYDPAIIFIAYPNNPTGNLFNDDDIKMLLKNSNGLIVVDEAYAPFANASFIHELDNFPNLLIMRTVSKLGLAGLRLGYLLANPFLIEQFDKIRLPYNINCLTQATAEFALTHQALFDHQSQQICKDREIMMQNLRAIKGLMPYPSAANFILFKSLVKPAEEIFKALLDDGILIKNMSKQGGILHNCLRVTIGKEDENMAFIDSLKKIMSI